MLYIYIAEIPTNKGANFYKLKISKIGNKSINKQDNTTVEFIYTVSLIVLLLQSKYKFVIKSCSTLQNIAHKQYHIIMIQGADNQSFVNNQR